MDNCFTSYARIYSLGVHWKVYFRHVLHIPRRQGIPPLSGIRIGIRISWRNGMAADSHGTRVPDAWSAALRQASQFPSRKPGRRFGRPGNLAVGQRSLAARYEGRRRELPRLRAVPAGLDREALQARCHTFPVPVEPPAAGCRRAARRRTATTRRTGKRTPRTSSRGPYRPIRAGPGRPRRRTGQDEALAALARRAATGHQTSRSPGTSRPAIPARSSPRAGARIHDENQASRGRFT